MKVLNLYAGIGGNRKLWTNCEVTAVEFNEEIAGIYSDFFPNDKVIIGDAHQYLLDNYKDFDFIWSSPPCQSHSDIKRCGVYAGLSEPLFPDMKLYQEIIFLQNFSKCQFVIENVVPYYQPLIQPTAKLQRHLFWSNFNILQSVEDIQDKRGADHCSIHAGTKVYDVDLSKYKINNKRQILRNMVNPELGLYIFKLATGQKIETNQMQLF